MDSASREFRERVSINIRRIAGTLCISIMTDSEGTTTYEQFSAREIEVFDCRKIEQMREEIERCRYEFVQNLIQAGATVEEVARALDGK